MSLTGNFVLVLLALLTIAAVAVVVRYWSRFANRGFKSLAGRAGAIAGVQLMLLLTVCAAANDYYGFYSSWGQLAGLASGDLGGSGAAALGNGQTSSTVTVQSTGGLQMPNGSDPQKVGELQYTTIHGQRTGLSATAIIYLPPQYFQAAYKDTDFPAAIVSTGYPGDVTKLVSLLRYPSRLATGIALGTDKPMVLVMMSPMIVAPRDTECTDVPGGGPQAESFWADDVPNAVEHQYRVTGQARGWGLIGDSTGGYCALKVAMMNSDKFGAAVSLSGYFDALEDGTTGDLYGGSQSYRNANDLMWRIENLPSPPISVLLTTSKSGEDDYHSTLDFAKDAKAPMKVSTLIRADGGHNFSTWNAEIAPAMQWLSNQLD
ncbi:MAG TPA: alpha/beta hydrolase-fold protein [Actinocrinis sp.]|jgi:enterochelin esterase-like enzyme